MTTTDKQKAVTENLRFSVLFANKENKPMRLQERMAHYNVPAVSIAVINRGVIEWVDTYGVSDVEVNKPATNQTMFQAGSISKSLTALGILYLVQQDKLSLDTNVNDYLQSWQVPDNDFTITEKVTLRRILSHSAGLTVAGFPGYQVGKRLPSILQILDGIKPPANTDAVRVHIAPGTQWQYAGGGTTIAQLLIEEVTGEPFAEWMKVNVLNKLDMKDSTFNQFIEGSLIASGHDKEGKVIFGKHHLYPEMAAAGLWTTANDIAKLVVYLQQSFAHKDNHYIHFELIKEMLTKQVRTKGKYDHGLGVFLKRVGNEIIFDHNGQDAGFIAQYRGLVNQQCGFAIMMNADAHAWYLMEEIAHSIEDVYGWKHFPAVYKTMIEGDEARYREMAGEYKLSASEERIIISAEDKQLFLQEHPSMPKVMLHREKDDVFFTQEGGHQLTFDQNYKFLLLKDHNDNKLQFFKT